MASIPSDYWVTVERAAARLRVVRALDVKAIDRVVSAASVLLGTVVRDCDDFGHEFWVVGDEEYQELDEALTAIQEIVTGVSDAS